jgi:hypothetical protein
VAAYCRALVRFDAKKAGAELRAALDAGKDDAAPLMKRAFQGRSEGGARGVRDDPAGDHRIARQALPPAVATLIRREVLTIMQKPKLSKAMTVEQFDRGYWYASDLQDFADAIGIPSAKKLRKDELEKAIKTFLRTGKVESPTKRALSRTGARDIDRGLRLDLPIVSYTSNRETKTFIEREAEKLAPGLKRRSGVRYRLNRWREEQLTAGRKITYGDLVREYVKLTQSEEPFARIPHGRYINFISDFLAGEKRASRDDAIRAWEELKRLDVPKDYRAWVKHRASARR